MICKICSRRFANGKAIGGHMRSHFAKLQVSRKTNPSSIPNNLTEFTPKSTSSSSSLNNMQTYRSGEFFDLLMRDDNEAESSKNSTKGRTKRPLKSMATVVAALPQPEPESVSSVTENILSDREAAMYLVMLSTDKWTDKDKELVRRGKEVKKEKYEYVEDQDEDTYVLTCNQYKCNTCNKRFSSYQALGGHKASHRKTKMKMQQEGSSTVGGGHVHFNQRIFKCPFCDKVFESGQAFGGHKKIHFSYLSVTKAAINSGENLIDLNLPAPEVDSEVSQI